MLLANIDAICARYGIRPADYLDPHHELPETIRYRLDVLTIQCAADATEPKQEDAWKAGWDPEIRRLHEELTRKYIR